MKIKEKQMKVLQAYPSVLIETYRINSATQEPKSAFRGLMQRRKDCGGISVAIEGPREIAKCGQLKMLRFGAFWRRIGLPSVLNPEVQA